MTFPRTSTTSAELATDRKFAESSTEGSLLLQLSCT